MKTTAVALNIAFTSIHNFKNGWAHWSKMSWTHIAGGRIWDNCLELLIIPETKQHQSCV